MSRINRKDLQHSWSSGVIVIPEFEDAMMPDESSPEAPTGADQNKKSIVGP